jgi:hypothetical protein
MLNASVEVIVIASRPSPRSKSWSRLGQAAKQIITTSLQGRFENLGIGSHEIGWRNRVHKLARIKLGLVRAFGIQSFDFLDRGQNRVSGQ